MHLLSDHLLVVQIGGIAAAFAALWLAPPASGTMLLVPVTPAAQHGMIARAVANGARLIDAGPIPGSMIVYGDRASLGSGMLANGVLLLAGPRSGCGTPA